jgi:hypothetical protein
MGRWVSVQFSNGDRTSVALLSDSYGVLLVEEAEAHAYYLRTLSEESGISVAEIDPGVMMFDFIHRVLLRKRMFRGIYTLRSRAEIT